MFAMITLYFIQELVEFLSSLASTHMLHHCLGLSYRDIVEVKGNNVPF